MILESFLRKHFPLDHGRVGGVQPETVVYGVRPRGAREAGHTSWVALLQPAARLPSRPVPLLTCPPPSSPDSCVYRAPFSMYNK